MRQCWQKVKDVIFNRLFRDEVLRLNIDARFLEQHKSFKFVAQPTYYVIRREGVGHGFFSNFLHVLMNVVIAEKYGWIPVVDQQTKTTLYHDDKLRQSNLWYKYFEGNWDIFELLERDVRLIFSDEKFPYVVFQQLLGSFLDFRGDNVKYLQALCQHYMAPRREYVDEVDQFLVDRGADVSQLIGVHWRRTDIISVGRKPASLSELCTAIDGLLKKGDGNKIFLCTDQEQSIAQLTGIYGDALLYTDCYRSENNNPIHLKHKKGERIDHAFLCGKEVLIDALILSRCRYIIGKASNVMISASILGGFLPENIFKLSE